MSDIDLMTDIGFDAGKTPIEVIHIVVLPDNHFNVILNGRMSDALGWDEMLGQITELTHPKIRSPRYAMLSREEVVARTERYAQNFKEKQP